MASADPQSSVEIVERIYPQFREELRRFFERRAPHKDRVEDLVQIVFVRLLGVPNLDEVKDLRGYMYGVAWNALRDENKRVQREQKRTVSLDPAEIERFQQENGLWDANCSADITVEQLAQILHELSPNCRNVFLMHLRDRLTYNQISEATGINVHTVHKHIVTANTRIRDFFHANPSINK